MKSREAARLNQALRPSVSTSLPSSEPSIPLMDQGWFYPPVIPDKDRYEVEFDGPDGREHHLNWSVRRKLVICCFFWLDHFLRSGDRLCLLRQWKR